MPNLTSADRRRLEQMMADPPAVHSWWKADEFPDIFREDGSPVVHGLEACEMPEGIFGADIVADSSLPYASLYEASILHNRQQISTEEFRRARSLWEADQLPTDAPHRYQQPQAQPQQAVKPQPQQQPEQPPYGRSLQEASELYMNDRISGDDYAVARALYDNGFLPAN